MNELFIQPVQFEKVAYQRVSENPAEWTGNIMERFYNQFPYFAQAPVSVTLTQKDEAKGYAIGQIKIEEGAGLVIPIIMQNFELFPFDVAIMGGNTIPLTNATLNMYVQGRGAFLRIVKPEAGDITNSLFNTSFSQQIVPTYVTESYKQASASEDSMVEYLKVQLLAEQAVKSRTNAKNIGSVVGGAVGSSMGYHPVSSATTGAAAGIAVHGIIGNGLFEDQVLDKMQKAALVGGQPKADELFLAALDRYNVKHSRNDLYILLAFRKWAVEQGITTSHWNIPGYEKTGQREASDVVIEHKADTTEGGVAPKSVEKDEEKKKKVKTASVLDCVLPTITQDMKNRFFDVLQKSASITEGFKRNGTSSVVLKIASAMPEVIDLKDKVRKELDRDLQYIYKYGSHEWHMILGSSRVVDPVEVVIDDIAAKNMEHVKTAAKYEMPMEKISSCDAFITTESGRRFLFMDAGNYIELDPNVKVASKPFTTHIEYSKPSVTKMAMWSVNETFTDPFEVTRIWINQGRHTIEASTGLEKKSYVLMKGIDTPYDEKGITYLPDSAKFIKMGSPIRVPQTTVDVWANGNEVYHPDNATYVLRGNQVGNFMKTSSREVDLHKASWTILQLGGTKEDIEKIAALKPGQSYIVPHELSTPLSFDTVVEKWNEENAVAAERIQTILNDHDLIKEASVIGDVPTVDAVLSLNFVNRNNVRQFAEAAPELMNAAQTLAQMLLQTRLGVHIVEENVLRSVMLGLIEVVEVLQGISNLAGRK